MCNIVLAPVSVIAQNKVGALKAPTVKRNASNDYTIGELYVMVYLFTSELMVEPVTDIVTPDSRSPEILPVTVTTKSLLS